MPNLKLKCHSCGFRWRQKMLIAAGWIPCPDCGKLTTTLTKVVEKNNTHDDVIDKVRIEDAP